jgi:alpha,alpha-trehalose phosphorylase
MHIPYDEAFGIHPQDDAFLEKEVWDLPNTPPDKLPLLLHYHPLVIYRHQVLKQADVVLALYLLSSEFTPTQKRADFEYYDPLTTGDSTLSSVVQSIIAAEVGYAQLAVSYFRQAIFVDLADLHHNADAGVHVASVGGAWSALVGGFGGMRDYQSTWSFDPRLPADWDFLSFPVTLRGTRLRVRIEQGSICFSIETPGAGPLEVLVQGTPVVVTGDAPVVVPLAPVLVLQGRPSVRDIEGSIREDGSVIRAIVPSYPVSDEAVDPVADPS